MAVYLKAGVCGDYSRPIAWAIEQLHAVCEDYGSDLLITSIRDGNHRAGSLHYIGDAIDWRPFKKLDAFQIKDVIGAISNGRFGGQFDVVDEGNHFHVEYDPKETP